MLSVYQVVKRDRKVVEFEISMISEAISKAFIDSMAREFHPSILDMLAMRIEEDEETLSRAEEIKLKKILRKKVRIIRLIWKEKTAQIARQLRQLWMNRNKGSNRSDTSAVSDIMLLTMPTPPTAEAANRSLWQRGIISGAMA